MPSFAPWVLSSLLPFIAFGAAEPIAIPAALANAQTLSNNAPFSGAVYIVNPDGQQVVAQDNNWCPNTASVSCSNMGHPSWCCPANYACVSPANSNGLIGCCPSGNTCGGTVNVAEVHTVTVYPQQQTAVVYAQPPPQTTVYHDPDPAAAGFCATITMDGPGLPRAEQGQCGTILVVNEGAPSLKTLGVGAGVVTLILQLAFLRMFQRN
ncbi:hypothetical protein IAQ61_011346 [Plenodomus lingam]|uniref:GPI anchored protein n=1 Tax=Leptosphaeria maculans (strain JN3 / isolate v23.1.3 / race Av1-4-5-6-7-8) TaxID=985895 RepID=E5A9S6_LEPMJ|nr:hypothetical protein LEMA_P015470.1 [Plenodomus lingam JN3]KAH9859565.1 hypothetical protein IAQ61_011346 [Plenodomus lingam]CBY00417.1 hypothetical protein LEMA_P015470.1 [Plenodomus lingam JN3]